MLARALAASLLSLTLASPLQAAVKEGPYQKTAMTHKTSYKPAVTSPGAAAGKTALPVGSAPLKDSGLAARDVKTQDPQEQFTRMSCCP